MSRLISHPNKINSSSNTMSTATIVFGKVYLNKSKSKYTTIKMLLDSGASSSIAHARLFRYLNTYQDTDTVWNTMAGTLATSKRGFLNIKMPEFNESAIIKINCHVTTNKSNYDIIVGRDTLRELGIIIDFSNDTVTWNGSQINMKPPNCNTTEHYYISDPSNIEDAKDRMKRILHAKYEKANLNQLVKESTYFSKYE